MIAKENQELDQSQGPDPSNGKQPNPLDADSHAQAQAGHDKPEPPAQPECPRWTQLLLVSEIREGEDGESGGNHERRIEKNQTRLGEQPVLCRRSQQLQVPVP